MVVGNRRLGSRPDAQRRVGDHSNSPRSAQPATNKGAGRVTGLSSAPVGSAAALAVLLADGLGATAREL